MTKMNVVGLKKDLKKMRDEWLVLGDILKRVIYTEEYDEEQEKKFLSLKNTIGRHQRVLSQRNPDKNEFDFGGVQIANMLKTQVVSLNQVSSRNEQDQKKILQDWHQVYIRITYVYGAFAFIEENKKNKPSPVKRVIKKVARK